MSYDSATRAKNLKKKHILIAEDDPMLQRAYQRMLGQHNLVQIVSSADEAITLLKTVKFDAIISDYDLGATTGAQILGWITLHQPENVGKFIFVTGTPIATTVPVIVKPALMADVRKAIDAITP
jgi:DNA-binding NarL/FixJ family response regulator